MASEDPWKPGSFTKNFSWGESDNGLVQLYENIRIGFAGVLADVPRDLYRERVRGARRPEHVPPNFFLFNKSINGTDHIVVDELVFQALKSDHSPRFDKLALFALHFSRVGKWRRQKRGQRYPARWAQQYIKDRLATAFEWNADLINARDIEAFITGDSRYEAEGAKKVSTNLNYLYSIGRIGEMATTRVERWWVDALFLALDRQIEDRLLDGAEVREGQYASLLLSSEFLDVTGPRSFEKELAVKHVTRLFTACGGRQRFEEDRVRELVARLHREGEIGMANDDRPRGAVYPTNPKILKSIPWACAPLAHAAGFLVLDPEQMAAFDDEAFVRQRTETALASLREDGITPAMTAAEVEEMAREK